MPQKAPSSSSARTIPSSPTVYGELRELFNGFWMLEVSSKEEAIEWAKRAPLGAGSQMEIRRVTGPEDFPQDNEWIQKEQQWIEEGRVGRG